ncbi:MAG: 2Fe-2S iron-sulfur cluster-binding protein, partial [Candidatus Omnitrophica bacterium]|nr:2Fe-2S iron-sulfur cluster-binding protein [Candidatus Omnitrophota bacterium]
MQKFKVTFLPEQKTVEVEQDKTILSAAISAGIYLNSACGGDGVCGRCKVILKKGKVLSQPNGAISLEEKNKQIYLACLTAIHSDLEVEIPASSRMTFENLTPQEVKQRLKGVYSDAADVLPAETKFKEGSFKHSPFVSKVYLELSAPSLADSLSDLERLLRGLKETHKITHVQAGLFNIRQLGELCRDADWKITVTLGKRNQVTEILQIEPLDTTDKNFGFCFDIGTTTISGQLIDLNSGLVLGTKASYNKQAAFGSDVITRIIYAKDASGLDKLHNAVVDTM